MATAYDFTTELDLGAMGVREVNVSYSYDKGRDVVSLMGVYLHDYSGSIIAEILDYLSWRTSDELQAEAEADLPKQLAEEAAYAAECRADEEREARLFGSEA